METDRKFFLVTDVARMWGEERARQQGKDPATAKPLSSKTVWWYLNQSMEARPGRRRNLYADNPPPLPVHLHLRALAWFPDPGETLADLERRLRLWYHSRPGQGAGGGRPPKTPRQPAV